MQTNIWKKKILVISVLWNDFSRCTFYPAMKLSCGVFLKYYNSNQRTLQRKIIEFVFYERKLLFLKIFFQMLLLEEIWVKIVEKLKENWLWTDFAILKQKEQK